MKENVKPRRCVIFPSNLSFQYKFTECLMYARQCSRSWADGSMRQALTLMELAFQWWERKWTSKQKHHAISDYDSSYERRRRTSSSDCCDLLCDMLVLPSAFNLHEDIKVTKTLRLPDSWPSFKELGVVKASPASKKKNIQPLGETIGWRSWSRGFPGNYPQSLGQEMLINITGQKWMCGTGQSARSSLTICL